MNRAGTTRGGASLAAKAGVISALVLLFALLCGLLPVAPRPATEAVFPGAPQFYDSTRQIRFHRGLLIATAVVALALIRARGRTPLVDALMGAAGSGRAIWRALGRVAPAVIFLGALVEFPKLKWSIIGAASAVGIVWLGFRRGDRASLRRILPAVLVVCTAAMTIPGFALTPNLSPSATVAIDVTEIHYSISVSQGDRLSQGGHLFTNVTPHYGVLEPFVLAVVEKARGLLDLGTHIHIVQAMQVVFALAAFLCYWLWSRRRLLATAFGFLPVLACVHTLHNSVFCPNQSGWRFAGLPLGLLALISIRGAGKTATTLLGCALGALLLFNPETGIVIAAAYVTYIATGCLRAGEGVGGMMRAFLRFGLGAAAVLVAFVFIYKIGLGDYPFPRKTGGSYTLTRFAGGYGGEKIYFSVSWIVILTLSLLRGHPLVSLSAGQARLATARSVVDRRGHAGVVRLFRQSTYGLEPLDVLVPVRVLRHRSRTTGLLEALLAGAAARPPDHGICVDRSVRGERFVPAPVGLSGRLGRLAQPPRGPRQRSVGRALVGGPGGRGPATGRIRSRPVKGDLSHLFLERPVPHAARERCGLRSALQRPLRGRFRHGRLRKISRLDREAKRPAELLFDDAAVGPAGSKERTAYMARFKSRLSTTFRESGTASGWEIWKVRPTANGATSPGFLPPASDQRPG